MSSQDNLEEIPPYGIYDGERNSEGLRHGQGKNTFPTGDIYEGQYVNGKRHGQGKFTFKTGGVYAGEYQMGERTGKGTFKYADKSQYTGEFVKGKRHGRGIYTYVNGDTFEGEWVDDVKVGPGIYTFKTSGAKKEGVWVNNVLQGPGKIILNDHVISCDFENSDSIKSQAPVQVQFTSNGYSVTWNNPALVNRIHATQAVDPAAAEAAA